MKGEKAVAGVAADDATREVLGLDVPVKRDTDGFMDWLRDFVSGYGGEAMVTDGLSACKPVVRRLGVDVRIRALIASSPFSPSHHPPHPEAQRQAWLESQVGGHRSRHRRRG